MLLLIYFQMLIQGAFLFIKCLPGPVQGHLLLRRGRQKQGLYKGRSEKNNDLISASCPLHLWKMKGIWHPPQHENHSHAYIPNERLHDTLDADGRNTVRWTILTWDLDLQRRFFDCRGAARRRPGRRAPRDTECTTPWRGEKAAAESAIAATLPQSPLMAAGGGGSGKGFGRWAAEAIGHGVRGGQRDASAYSGGYGQTGVVAARYWSAYSASFDRFEAVALHSIRWLHCKPRKITPFHRHYQQP